MSLGLMNQNMVFDKKEKQENQENADNGETNKTTPLNRPATFTSEPTV